MGTITANNGTWRISINGAPNGPSMSVSNATTSGFTYSIAGGSSQTASQGADNSVSLNGQNNQIFNGTLSSATKMSGTVADGAKEDSPTWEADFVPPPPLEDKYNK